MWFLQKLIGKMDPFEAKSQLDNHQHQDLQLHSDPSIDKDNNLVQILAQDLENLVFSCKDKVLDQYPQVVINDEVIERRRLEKVVEMGLKDSGVLEDQETDGCEIGCGNVEEVGEFKGKYEIEIKDEDVGSEIGDYENNNNNNDDGKYDEHVEGLGNEGKNDGRLKGYHYPLRLDAEDCSYYVRTGMCKFGSNCKFNHPLRRKSQPAKETKNQKEENVEKQGQIECKHHMSSVGCKYGKACKFNHGRGKSVKTPVVDYNFVGLPIRPGEKECPYYMRNGSCKYGPSCRFNHPDPTAAGGGDSPKTYVNHGPLPLQTAPKPNIPNMPWSAPRTPDPTTAFVPMLYSQTQNMPPPKPDWNGYQAPAPVPAHLYPSSEQGLPIPPAFFLNNPPGNTSMYTHQQQPTVVLEYPERPSQPDCSYFMKTGVCKYRASCKFHHPPSRVSRNLRDQNICTYFSKHGTCKYGPACKYDHPVKYNSNSNPAREGYDGSNGPSPLIQQSV